MGLYQKTLGSAIDETLKVCNDFRADGQDGIRWTRTEVKHAVRRLYLDFVRETASMKGEEVIPLVEFQNIYDLPSDCLYPTRIVLTLGAAYVFTNTTVDSLTITGTPLNAGGTPYTSYRDAIGHNQFGVWPSPGTSLDGEEVTITYVRTPASWADEVDVPDIAFPEWLQKDIRFGAAARILSDSGDRPRMRKAQMLDAFWNSRIILFKELTATPVMDEGMVPV